MLIGAQEQPEQGLPGYLEMEQGLLGIVNAERPVYAID